MKNILNFLIIISVISISACGTLEVYEETPGTKRIELSGVGIYILSGHPANKYSHPESQAAISAKAMEECPGGYKKLKEQYVADDGSGKDKLVWHVKCLDEVK